MCPQAGANRSRVGPPLVAALALLVLPLPSSGQSDASEAVSTLKVGQQVRVQAPGITVEGAGVTQIEPGMLYVAQDGQEWVIEVRSIERLEVREHPIVRNALLYGLIGTLLGFGVDKFMEPNNNSDGVRDGAARGLAGGTVFGILFGLTQWRWEVRFP